MTHIAPVCASLSLCCPPVCLFATALAVFSFPDTNDAPISARSCAFKRTSPSAATEARSLARRTDAGTVRSFPPNQLFALLSPPSPPVCVLLSFSTALPTSCAERTLWCSKCDISFGERA